jgi:hypothetical protein
MEYDRKCNCGHPYSVAGEGHIPMKDVEFGTCPSCQSRVSYNSTYLTVEFRFDPNWSKSENGD